MTASQVPVANILIELRNQNYKVTQKQVYNVRAREKKRVRGNRTSSEQLRTLADAHGYLHFHQTIPGKKKGTSELTDLLFAHPDSINLLKHYPFVLIADCTYNTNKYKMPLLEIVGITPVNKNFSVFYGFLENERGTAYDWAFKCIREVLDTDEEIVFVTDKEKPLMNAIQKYFPNARHLLCRRHIEKDVEAWVKRVTKNCSRGEAFAKGRWKNLVNSQNRGEYLENERICFEKYRLVPGLKKYLKETWLDLYKERFVSAWINNILHFGNVTTNRVEGAHASLKRLLKTSNGGFNTILKQFIIQKT
ncbi:PKS-NRPS hybrid synthetase cheA-like [Silene latifolia]|uniref:PKS-NRPS hybrid synthetase cheA-like n=1 Tax=Silene latifolia TaxID=37657 RepID=UPI003D76A584